MFSAAMSESVRKISLDWKDVPNRRNFLTHWARLCWEVLE